MTTAFAILRHLVSGPGVGHRAPLALRRRYAALYEAEVVPTADGGATCAGGRLWRRRGVHVLHLRGDRFEMAFQHGRLLRDEIAHGSLERAARIAHDNIRNSLGDGVLASAVSWYTNAAIAEPMLRNGLRRARERGDDSLLDAYGLSEGSGVPVRTIVHAALGPESAQTLLGKTAGTVTATDPSQCTSFAAWGSATAGGQLIIGRNTDYPLNGYFDAHPTVIYFEPTDGALRYMTVTSAGFHNAGVCGMNEAGIYLGIHTVPAATVSEEGLPIFMVGQQILREARTLDEVEALLEDARPAAGWNYHAVSTREHRAVTFEMSCTRLARRPSRGDYHVTTNHWTQPEMAAHHLFVNDTIETDTRERMARAAEMIEQAAGTLDAAGAAAILADKYDRATGRIRRTPNVIATGATVSSSVWLPAEGVVYVAAGRAPVSQTGYVGLPTLDAFDPERLADTAAPILDPTGLPSCRPDMVEAEHLFIEARCALEYHHDTARAAELAAAATALDADNPASHIMLALFAIRAGRHDVARDAVDAALKFAPGHPLARFLRGRLHAHFGDVDAAKEDLRAVGDGQRPLPIAAGKTLARLRRRRRLPLPPTELAIMTFLPDAYRYTGLLN
jgi:tetratricopeptide (TPR) repeat protein